MKICKLKLKNLNSFRQEVDLDFESSPLGDASLVAITGPTGAGKTTLLDAICVALYGKTPRLSGTGSQHSRHLISHGEREGFAEVHFIANETRYIAIWSLRRGSPAEVRLSYAEDNKLISDKLSGKGKTLGSSQRTVSEEVESILGLDFDAFRRSVMLAQGEFAAFLKAKQEDRRQILEATAGIHIYDLLRQALNDKVNEVEAANADILDKLNKIPEASREQLSEADTELDRLTNEADVLETRSQEIQREKERETKRTEDFEKLQVSEKRRKELLEMQPEMETLHAEKENADRAERLRTEKQKFDTATSELETAENALRVATTEKTEAEKQVETDQADFEKKETAYQTASTEHDRKAAVYTDAKIDIERAEERFAEASKRNPNLVDMDNQVDLLEDELADKQTEQIQLQKQVAEARTFLDENPLPADRQHRRNRATGLLAELDSQKKQLETVSTNKAQHEKKVASLKHEIEKLSKTFEKKLAEKAEAEATLEEASVELNGLLATGTREEWNTRKQQATKAQPIAQKFEAAADDLASSENRLCELNKAKAELDTELGQIEAELTSQTEVSQHVEEIVKRCEAARESALLANPINRLRQHLHAGEPCLVCGATEHPSADVVEPENEERLQDAEGALESAKVDAQAAQEQMQALKTKQVAFQQDKRNTTKQIEGCTVEIEDLRNEMALLLTAWQEIYPDTEVSYGWTADQIARSDTAVAHIVEAEQAHTQASHACETASQQLENCKNDIRREKASLSETEQQLQDISEDVEGLKIAVADIETRFWDLLPKAFHGVTPKETKDLFENKMQEVEACENELRRTETQLHVLKTNIEADQSNLENLKDRHEELRAEIDEYRREGEGLLDIAREKTDGLETEAQINVAIEKLETELRSKESRRDAAEQQLQNSQKLLIQKQTTHGHCEEQYEVSTEKLETARDAYFEKLSEAGFDSPEAHDNAFRDNSQLQELTNQIDTHEDEKQQFALEVTELRTRFEETPFDPEALERIEVQAEEIGTQLQAKQQEIGAQRQKIDDLKKHLKQREALGSEVAAGGSGIDALEKVTEHNSQKRLARFCAGDYVQADGQLSKRSVKIPHLRTLPA